MQSTNVWLGGSDEYENYKWIWPDGTNFWNGNSSNQGGTSVEYSNWNDDEPNNHAGEDEVHLEAIIHPAGRWNDQRGGDNHFVCEKGTFYFDIFYFDLTIFVFFYQ